jgi:hypothetical protein
MGSSSEGSVELELALPPSDQRLVSTIAKARGTTFDEELADLLSSQLDRVMGEYDAIDWNLWSLADGATLVEFAALCAEINPGVARLTLPHVRNGASSVVRVGFLNDSLRVASHSDDRLVVLTIDESRQRRFYSALRLGLSALAAGQLESLNGVMTDEAFVSSSQFSSWATLKGLWPNQMKLPHGTKGSTQTEELRGWKRIGEYFASRFGLAKQPDPKTMKGWMPKGSWRKEGKTVVVDRAVLDGVPTPPSQR